MLKFILTIYDNDTTKKRAKHMKPFATHYP